MTRRRELIEHEIVLRERLEEAQVKVNDHLSGWGRQVYWRNLRRLKQLRAELGGDKNGAQNDD